LVLHVPASQSAAKGKGSTKGQAQPKKSVSIPHQVGKDIQLMLLLFYPDVSFMLFSGLVLRARAYKKPYNN
jgi:hypothetical protein